MRADRQVVKLHDIPIQSLGERERRFRVIMEMDLFGPKVVGFRLATTRERRCQYLRNSERDTTCTCM